MSAQKISIAIVVVHASLTIGRYEIAYINVGGSRAAQQKYVAWRLTPEQRSGATVRQVNGDGTPYTGGATTSCMFG